TRYRVEGLLHARATDRAVLVQLIDQTGVQFLDPGRRSGGRGVIGHEYLVSGCGQHVLVAVGQAPPVEGKEQKMGQDGPKPPGQATALGQVSQTAPGLGEDLRPLLPGVAWILGGEATRVGGDQSAYL